MICLYYLIEKTIIIFHFNSSCCRIKILIWKTYFQILIVGLLKTDVFWQIQFVEGMWVCVCVMDVCMLLPKPIIEIKSKNEIEYGFPPILTFFFSFCCLKRQLTTEENTAWNHPTDTTAHNPVTEMSISDIHYTFFPIFIATSTLICIFIGGMLNIEMYMIKTNFILSYHC